MNENFITMSSPIGGNLMPSSKMFLLFLLLCVCSSNSLSFAASDTYTNFVQCLSKNSIPDQVLSKIVYSPNNSSFSTVLAAYIKNRRFNTSSTPKPLIIVTPTDYSQVQKAVVCAKSLGLLLKIRSGGHDYEGISYVSSSPFVILDMFNIRQISVNIQDETAWVDTGATLGELYYRIWEKSPVHAFPGGVCSTVGVGGHFGGAGYGNMLRKFGLTADNVLDARIVNVKGEILDRKGMGEDLFWAINGGGSASFGVVLAYKIKLVRVPKVVTYFRVEKTLAQNATDAVDRWQYVADTIDDGLFMRVLLQPITVKGGKKGEKTIRATFIALYLGDSNTLFGLLTSQFPQLGLKKSDCLEMSWIRSVLYWGNFDSSKQPSVLLSRNSDSVNFLKRKSDYVLNPIPRSGLESMWKKMIELGKTGLVFNPYGGKMAQVPESATPFPHRAGIKFKMQYSINWQDEAAAVDKQYIAQIRDLYSFMTPFVSNNPRQAFLNYRDLDVGTSDNGKDAYNQAKVYGVKYFKNNFDRLVKIKTAVDPENFFRNEQSIPPLLIGGRRGTK